MVSRGYSSLRCGLLIAVAPLVEHRLRGMRASVAAALELSSCGAWA